MKNKRQVFLGLVLIPLFSCSGKIIKGDSNNQDHLRKIDHQITPLSNKGDYWKAIELNLEGKPQLVGLVVNKNSSIIAISDSGAIYKSIDGGTAWERLKIPIAEKHYITSFSFIQPDSYCVSTSDYLKSLNGRVESNVLYSQDGMKKWSTVYQSNNIYINKVSLINKTGAIISGSKRDSNSLVFLFTKDMGREWVDINGDINSIIPVNQSWSEAVDVTTLENDQILTIASNGKAYLYSSESHKWIDRGDFDINVAYDKICRVKKMNNALYLVGGRDGPEGFGGYFKRLTEDATLTTITLPVNLKGYDLTSKGDIVLCGDSLPDNAKDNFNTEKREGVIIYSSIKEGGWKIIYRNPKIADIRSVAFINDETVVAISGDGTFIKLSQVR